MNGQRGTGPALREGHLRRALVIPGGLWTELSVVGETGSTNADLVASARLGAPSGAVLVAERQSAGRGRLGRTWVAPARAGITVSVLLRPSVPPGRLAWLALVAGVALVESVGRVAAVDAALKWPNDLLVRPRSGVGGYGKCAGVLAETVADSGSGAGLGGVVLGVGLNVLQGVGELPEPADALAVAPTSLALADAACLDREVLLRAFLAAFERCYRGWVESDGDPAASGVLAAYRLACVTIGREVTVSLPDGQLVAGTASGIDGEGRLVVGTPGGRLAMAAGDVRHVRW